MQRRKFIELAAVGAVGLVLPATARMGESITTASPAPRLLDVLHDESVVYDIGQRYREMMPDEDNARVLAEAILEQPAGKVTAALGARVERQVQRDFATGRTVKVNGWILSVTEARQCALYSLQS